MPQNDNTRAARDDDLVARVVAGDIAARDELVSAYLSEVWKTVYLANGGGPDTEDFVHIAVMQALERLPSYRGPGKFKSWLDMIAINTVRQHYRRLSIRKKFAMQEHPDESWAGGGLFEEELDRKRCFERLAWHLGKIRNDRRIALVMSVFKGHSAKEIAELTGCSEEAAWKRVRRGFKELTARLDRDPAFKQFKKELIQ